MERIGEYPIKRELHNSPLLKCGLPSKGNGMGEGRRRKLCSGENGQTLLKQVIKVNIKIDMSS